MSVRVPLDLRLLPLALATWSGTWIILTTGWWWAALPAVAAGVPALIYRPHGRHRQRSYSAIGIGVVGGALLATALVATHGYFRGNALEQAAASGKVVDVNGVVLSDPKRTPFGQQQRTQVRLQQVCTGDICEPSSEILTLTTAQELQMGQHIEVHAIAKPARAGEEATAAITSNTVVVTAPAQGLYAATAAIRTAFLQTVQALSPAGQALLPGVAIGARNTMPEQLSADMKIASLTHLTAVSGAHMAVILGTVLALAAFLPRALALPLGLATIIGMYALVGPQPSIRRAAVMAVVMLIAFQRGRRGSALPALALAVVINICWWPYSATSYGFALSVSATAGLILLVPLLTRVLSRRLPGRLATAIAVPLAAQLAVAPLLATLSGGIQLYSIPANMVASLIFVPLLLGAMLAALFSPLWPAAALVVAHGADLPARALAGLATRVAQLPGAQLALPAGVWGPVFAGAGSLAILAWLIWLDRRPRRRRAAATSDCSQAVSEPAQNWVPSRDQAARQGLIGRLTNGSFSRQVSIAVAVLLVVGAVVWWWPSSTSRWHIRQCDVGQGSALLARTGPHSAIMVDTGDEGKGGDTCVKAAGITEIDILFLSHPHSDHVRGLDAILTVADVKHIVIGPSTHPRANRAHVEQVAATHHIPLLDPVRDGGAVTGQFDVTNVPGLERLGWELWWPDGAAAAAWDTEEGANDLSLVVALAVYGPGGEVTARVVVLGDVEIPAQERLTKRLQQRCGAVHRERCAPVDIVVMAHHGSKAQAPALATYFAAPIVLVSVGANDYGHPHPQTIALYRQAGGQIMRTDESGALEIEGTQEAVVVTPVGGP